MAATKERAELSKEYQELLKSARALVSATEDLADAKAKEARTKLLQKLESVEDTAGVLEDRVMDNVHTVENYIRERPLTSVGVAALAGFMLSCLRGRR